MWIDLVKSESVRRKWRRVLIFGLFSRMASSRSSEWNDRPRIMIQDDFNRPF